MNTKEFIIEELNHKIYPKLEFSITERRSELYCFSKNNINSAYNIYCQRCLDILEIGSYVNSNNFISWLRCYACNKTIMFSPDSFNTYVLEELFLRKNINQMNSEEYLALYCLINSNFVTRKFIKNIVNVLIPEIKDLILLIL